MQRFHVLGVIPARYGSTRFPGKVLKPLRGRPIVEWVWRQAKKASRVDDVWIATDDERVMKAAESFGARAFMTSPELPSGSDRIAAVVAEVDVDLVVNIQGDEPCIDPATIDRAVEALEGDSGAMVSTARFKLERLEDLDNPNVVKVISDCRGRALYFSRSPLPSLARVEHDAESDELPIEAFKHLGMYVYRKEALMKFCSMAPSNFERIEKLEQLRFLENGYPIQVVDAESDSIGVDTPEDLEELSHILSKEDAE